MPVFRLKVHFMPYLFNNSTKGISCFIVLENGQEIKQEVAYADGNRGTASKSARDFRGNMIREEILTKKERKNCSFYASIGSPKNRASTKVDALFFYSNYFSRSFPCAKGRKIHNNALFRFWTWWNFQLIPMPFLFGID